jgi:cytochrome c-type biogenesis protein CcmH/NrfF
MQQLNVFPRQMQQQRFLWVLPVTLAGLGILIVFQPLLKWQRA